MARIWVRVVLALDQYKCGDGWILAGAFSGVHLFNISVDMCVCPCIHFVACTVQQVYATACTSCRCSCRKGAGVVGSRPSRSSGCTGRPSWGRAKHNTCTHTLASRVRIRISLDASGELWMTPRAHGVSRPSSRHASFLVSCTRAFGCARFHPTHVWARMNLAGTRYGSSKASCRGCPTR